MLTVLNRHSENTKGNKPQWNCQCECGNTKIIPASYLRSGGVTSCGCDLLIDLTDRRFGKLVVIGRYESNDKKDRYKWICRCDCGNSQLKINSYNNLVHGNTVSCGCHRSRILEESRIKHNLRYSREYKIWTGIKERCYNKNNKNYETYGARGITMDSEWKESFEAFYRDMGDCPSSSHTIDRKDNNLGYFKDNCRWATRKEQANNKTTNILFTINGVTKNLTQWSEHYGVDAGKVAIRISRGMKFENAVMFDKFSEETKLVFEGSETTFGKLCKDRGINSRDFFTRLFRGLTISEALNV